MSKVKVKIIWVQTLVSIERPCSKGAYFVKDEHCTSICSQAKGNVIFFAKEGQRSGSRLQGQTFWYGWKGLVTMKVHVKDDSSYRLIVIGKVKAFLPQTDRQPNRRIGSSKTICLLPLPSPIPILRGH